MVLSLSNLKEDYRTSIDYVMEPTCDIPKSIDLRPGSTDTGSKPGRLGLCTYSSIAWTSNYEYEAIVTKLLTTNGAIRAITRGPVALRIVDLLRQCLLFVYEFLSCRNHDPALPFRLLFFTIGIKSDASFSSPKHHL